MFEFKHTIGNRRYVHTLPSVQESILHILHGRKASFDRKGSSFEPQATAYTIEAFAIVLYCTYLHLHPRFPGVMHTSARTATLPARFPSPILSVIFVDGEARPSPVLVGRLSEKQGKKIGGVGWPPMNTSMVY